MNIAGGVRGARAASTRRRGRQLVAAVSITAVVGSTLVAVGVSMMASADPGATPDPVSTPGRPHGVTELFREDFERGQSASGWTLLPDYTGSDGQRYQADPYWLTDCNGFIASEGLSGSANCASDGGDAVRSMARALDRLNGTSGNHALAAYTKSGTPVPGRMLQTTDPIPADPNGRGSRFLAVGVDIVEDACGFPTAIDANLDFSLVKPDSTKLAAFSSPVSPCTDATSQDLGAGFLGNARGGHYVSDTGVLVDSDAVGIVVDNRATTNDGNDIVLDNLRLLDVTPRVDASFQPAVQSVGGNATAVWTVTNSAEQGAKKGWSFHQTLPQGMSLVESSGSTCDTAEVTADATGLELSGDLRAGQAACTLRATLTASAATALTADAASVDRTVGMNTPSTTASLQFVQPGYTLTATATPAAGTPVTPGQDVAYRITVTNTSAVDIARTVTEDLSGILDDAVLKGSPTASRGTASVSGTTLSWTGTVAAGASVVIDYTVTVKAGDKLGDAALVGVLTGEGEGSSCPAGAPGAGCTTTHDVDALLLELTSDRKAGRALKPGTTVNWTLSVTNRSASTMTDLQVNDNLADVLDDASLTGPATLTGPGQVGLDDQTSVLTWRGDLQAGQSATITYAVTVSDPTSGNSVLVNTVSSPRVGSNCPAGATGAPCTVRQEITGLVFWHKTSDAPTSGSLLPGDTVTYRIEGRNLSGSTVTGARLVDDLSDVLDDADLDATSVRVSGGGSIDRTGEVLTWTGDLGKRGTVVIEYSVRVKDTTAGNHTMVNTAVSDAGGSCPAGATDPACTVTLRTGRLHLSVGTTQGTGDPVAPGRTLTYVATARNDSGAQMKAAAFTVDVSGLLEAATTDGAVSVQGPGAAGFDRDARTVTWTGDLAAGETVKVSWTAAVGRPAAAHTLRATVSATRPDTNCRPGSAAAECTVVNTVAGLEVTQAVDVPAGTVVGPGRLATYRVTVFNDAARARPGTTVAVDLAGVLDSADFQEGSIELTPSTGRATLQGTTLTWTGDLPALGRVEVAYRVRVRPAIARSHELVSVVSASAVNSTCPTGAETGCTLRTPASSFTLEKTASTAGPVAPGETLTYTLRVTNDSGDPLTGATAVDDASGVLDDADLVAGSLQADTGRAVLNPDTGRITWTGDLPAAGSAQITYQVKVRASGGDNSLVNTLSGDQVNTTCSDGTPGTCTSVVSVSGLSLKASSASRGPVVAGSSVVYRVQARNTGTVDLPAATFEMDLSDLVPHAGVDTDRLVVRPAGAGTVDWDPDRSVVTWTGPLAAGEAATVSFRAHVEAAGTAAGTHLRTVVTSTTPGSSCPAGSRDPACRTDDPVAGIQTVVTTDAPGAPVTGDRVEYRTVIRNTGGDPVQGLSAVQDLSDVVDDAEVITDSLNADVGAVRWDPATKTLKWTGDLDVDATATLTFAVTVADPETSGGNHVLRTGATLDAPGSDCAPKAATGVCAARDVGVAGFTVVTRASVSAETAVRPGDRIRFTVKGTNTGAVRLSGATFVDDLSSILDDADLEESTITTDAPELRYQAEQGKLSWVGTLDPGGSVVVSFEAVVRDAAPGAGGDNSVVNTVTSLTAGSNCATGSTDPRCRSVNPMAGLVFTKSDDTAGTGIVHPGLPVTYRIGVRNTGGAAARDVTFVEDLTGALDDATFDEVVSSGKGSATFDPAAGKLTWTGSLAAGASTEVVYRMQVTLPGTGDHRMDTVLTSEAPVTNCPAGSADPSCVSHDKVQELALTKKADKTGVVGVGEDVTYRIEVCNTGAVDYAEVSLSDDLTQVLDDATFNGDLVATSGTVRRDGVRVLWSGPLTQGGHVQITYSVKIAPLGSGDGILTNKVFTEAAGTNCPAGAGDAACRVVIDLRRAGGSATAGSLAFTGASLGLIPLGALLLVGSGIGALLLVRRRGRPRARRA